MYRDIGVIVSGTKHEYKSYHYRDSAYSSISVSIGNCCSSTKTTRNVIVRIQPWSGRHAFDPKIDALL